MVSSFSALARSAFLFLATPSLWMALRHSLYVHLAVPIHFCSLSFSSLVGYTRMRLALPGGGFSGVEGFPSFFFLDLFGSGGGGSFFALPSIVCRTASVMLCDKDSDDGDEVVGEFLLRVWVVVDS